MRLNDKGPNCNGPVIVTYEISCPHCRRNIFMIDNSKSPNYWRDKSELLEKYLAEAMIFIRDSLKK